MYEKLPDRLNGVLKSQNDKIKALEAEVKKLTTQSKHIGKLTISQVIIILIDKLKEKYVKIV